MANPNLSKLDWNEALKRSVDANEDAIRVNIIGDSATGGETTVEVELSHEDGDSVLTYSQSSYITSYVISTGIVGSIGGITDISNVSAIKVYLAPRGDYDTRGISVDVNIGPADGIVFRDPNLSLSVTGAEPVTSGVVEVADMVLRLNVPANTLNIGEIVDIHILGKSN